jgi:hypothetical protein
VLTSKSYIRTLINIDPRWLPKHAPAYFATVKGFEKLFNKSVDKITSAEAKEARRKAKKAK